MGLLLINKYTLHMEFFKRASFFSNRQTKKLNAKTIIITNISTVIANKYLEKYANEQLAI